MAALVNLLDYTATPLVLYAIIAYPTYTALQSPDPSYPRLLFGILAASTFYIISTLLTAVLKESKVERLGGHAPRFRTYTPWNLGVVVSSVYNFMNHKNDEYWTYIFKKAANPNNPNTIETVTAGQRLIFTRDEENIKAVLATQFHDYGKGEKFRKEWKDFLGLSIFTTDGELWHNSRQLLRPQFIKDRVSDLDTFEAHTQELLPLLAGDHPGATVRADDLFYRFTLDTATDFLMGASPNSLANGQSAFARAFTDVQRIQATIARAGPLNKLVPRKTFNEALKVLNDFMEHYIDATLALTDDELAKRSKGDESYTFLHALAGYTRDRQVLRDQIVAVLLAGRDTTAVTLSWCFYELAKSPDALQKLREEILSTVGSSRAPTYADLKGMKYLTATINETLRLYPVVPFNVRVALKDTTLPRGGGKDGMQPIGVAAGTPIGYSTLLLQRRTDIYPPTSPTFADSKSFSPDRWSNWNPKSWTYIPFNGGPRICIGQQFALTEMAYVIVRILQKYARIESRQEEVVREFEKTDPYGGRRYKNVGGGEMRKGDGDPWFPALNAEIVLVPGRGVGLAFHEE